MRVCSFEGCGRAHYGKGLCKRHYNQQYKRPPQPPCSFVGCGRASHIAGLCARHYIQKWKGQPLTPERVLPTTCSFPGCGRPHGTAGLCNGHYAQRLRGASLSPLRLTIRDRRTSFWSRVRKMPGDDGCWLWTGNRLPRGYGLFRGGLAHRESWEMEHGPIPEGMNVCHDCPSGDDPRCVRPEHLWVGTQAQNCQDMHAKGRARTGDQRGSRNGRAKLTEHDVVDVRSLRAFGATTASLAEAYGISANQIALVATRHNWRHVP